MKQIAIVLALLMPLKAIALVSSEQRLIDQYMANKAASDHRPPKANLEEVKKRVDALSPEINRMKLVLNEYRQNLDFLKQVLAKKIKVFEAKPDQAMSGWLETMREQITKFCCSLKRDPKAYAKALQERTVRASQPDLNRDD